MKRRGKAIGKKVIGHVARNLGKFKALDPRKLIKKGRR